MKNVRVEILLCQNCSFAEVIMIQTQTLRIFSVLTFKKNAEEHSCIKIFKPPLYLWLGVKSEL